LNIERPTLNIERSTSNIEVKLKVVGSSFVGQRLLTRQRSNKKPLMPLIVIEHRTPNVERF